MRDSNNINAGADDDIYDAVREACHLGRTNVRFIERRERKWELVDQRQRAFHGCGEALPATGISLVVISDIGGQFARGFRPEYDHFTRLRFTSLHGMPATPSRAC